MLYSLILLSVNFVYAWFNVWSLGYIGVFYCTFFNLLVSIFFSWWELYNIWFYNNVIDYSGFIWAELGNNILIYFNLRFDFFGAILSCVMLSGALFVITFVLVDMWDDKEGASFIINLGFFLIFMLLMTNSGNLIVFYLGWEGIALTSIFLVNFWSERVRSIKAAFKVFFINKIGDFFFLILIVLLIGTVGDVNFDVINSNMFLFLNNYFRLGSFEVPYVELVGVILVFSSCVKSAQIGFHIWLLEAMEAPLGASALMHSSTLVVAGLVLVFKLNSILELSAYCQILMYSLGVMSATLGSFIACFQYELKVIMAYSTISNMGYLFTLCSVGSYDAVIFVMVVHAYIKIFLFLVVGGIILHCNGTQDIRWMGGLLLYTPGLFVAYIAGGLCLVGLPYWSGYYCKFYILKSIFSSSILLNGGNYILLISYVLTFFYVFRLGYLVFLGSKNGHRKIYRLKPTSLLYLYDLIVLGFIILFTASVWINLVDTNYNFFGSGLVVNSINKLNIFFFELTYTSLYLWLLTYFIISVIVFVWFVVVNNFSWNFLKYWFLNFVLFIFLFIYFI